MNRRNETNTDCPCNCDQPRRNRRRLNIECIPSLLPETECKNEPTTSSRIQNSQKDYFSFEKQLKMVPIRRSRSLSPTPVSYINTIPNRNSLSEVTPQRHSVKPNENQQNQSRRSSFMDHKLNTEPSTSRYSSNNNTKTNVEEEDENESPYLNTTEESLTKFPPYEQFGFLPTHSWNPIIVKRRGMKETDIVNGVPIGASEQHKEEEVQFCEEEVDRLLKDYRDMGCLTSNENYWTSQQGQGAQAHLQTILQAPPNMAICEEIKKITNEVPTSAKVSFNTSTNKQDCLSENQDSKSTENYFNPSPNSSNFDFKRTLSQCKEREIQLQQNKKNAEIQKKCLEIKKEEESKIPKKCSDTSIGKIVNTGKRTSSLKKTCCPHCQMQEMLKQELEKRKEQENINIKKEFDCKPILMPIQLKCPSDETKEKQKFLEMMRKNIKDMEMEKLIKDCYCPGAIQDSINSNLNFNKLAFNIALGDDKNIPAQLPDIEPISLIEAFAKRIDVERKNVFNIKISGNTNNLQYIMQAIDCYFDTQFNTEINRAIKYYIKAERLHCSSDSSNTQQFDYTIRRGVADMPPSNLKTKTFHISTKPKNISRQMQPNETLTAKNSLQSFDSSDSREKNSKSKRKSKYKIF